MSTPGRLIATWLVLVATTGLSWDLCHGAQNLTPQAAGAAIIVIAFVKIRFVMLQFMELQHAPTLMRIACELWITVVCAGMLVLYRA